jgi:hypothetical protein
MEVRGEARSAAEQFDRVQQSCWYPARHGVDGSTVADLIPSDAREARRHTNSPPPTLDLTVPAGDHPVKTQKTLRQLTWRRVVARRETFRPIPRLFELDGARWPQSARIRTMMGAKPQSQPAPNQKARALTQVRTPASPTTHQPPTTTHQPPPPTNPHPQHPPPTEPSAAVHQAAAQKAGTPARQPRSPTTDARRRTPPAHPPRR